MDEKLLKLHSQVSKIEALKNTEEWGVEFQLWETTTKKLVGELFGEEGLNLFEQQRTTTTSYIDDNFNRAQYRKELDNKKLVITTLLADIKESKPNNSNTLEVTDKSVLKEIWAKEKALKENLLTTDEVQGLYERLVSHLKNTLPGDSLPGLRFRKSQTKTHTWWSTEDGYPYPAPWPQFEPYLELLAQHEAEKTIKRRMEIEGLFVESRSQGEDQHLLIGKRDGSGEKAHMVIDGKSGEIRIEDKRLEPTELLARIETILTLPNGRVIKTTREAVEEISDK